MEDLQDIVNALLMREARPAAEEHHPPTDDQAQPNAVQEQGADASGPLTVRDGVHKTQR